MSVFRNGLELELIADHGSGVVVCLAGRAEVLVLTNEDLQHRQVDAVRLLDSGGSITVVLAGTNKPLWYLTTISSVIGP